MFLDDELFEIAKSADYRKWSTKSEVLSKMKECVISRILKEHSKLKNDSKATDQDLFLCIKRCKQHWNNTLNKLRKRSIVNFPEDSFNEIIKTHSIFEGFRDKILDYIK
jgi:hypothetical protein